MQQLVTVENLWVDDRQLAEIRKTFAPNLSDLEFNFLVGIGRATGLNPFLREIWAVKYDQNRPAQIFIGRDGYRIGAQNHPDYRGHNVYSIYEHDKLLQTQLGDLYLERAQGDRGKLVGAYAYADRKDCMRMYAEVKLATYNTNRSVWKENPQVMIEKVAEAHALRRAFQKTFAGTYHEAEVTVEQLQGKRTYTEASKQLEQNNVLQLPAQSISVDESIALVDLMIEKNFTKERQAKALEYFKVKDFSELTSEQAEILTRKITKS